jgi:hypothetical protein
MKMMQLGRRAWRSAVGSGVGAAMIFAAACGGSESPRTQAETQPRPQAEGAARAAEVTEKPFASGGKIEMQLEAGNYTVRAGSGNAIRVTLGGNVGSAKVDVTTGGAQASVSVKETPHNNFQATIEVPRSADVVIRLTAGDLKVEAIDGSKDIESNAGNVDVVTGDSKDYASVDAAVKAGDLNAGVFGESQSGLFRSFTWSGSGKYTLRARLLAGNLTLRGK